MTATTAPTPEELAQQAFPNGCIRGRTLKLTDAIMADIRSATAAAIRQHSEALEAERDAAYQRGYDARQAEIVRALEEAGGRIVLTHGPASAGMVTLTNERAEAAEARATTAEAALAAMDPANPDWREVAMSNGKALGERNAAWDRLNAALAASQARETAMREALERLCGAMPSGDGLRYHHAKDEIVAARAAIQPQEPANE